MRIVRAGINPQNSRTDSWLDKLLAACLVGRQRSCWTDGRTIITLLYGDKIIVINYCINK